VPPDGFTSLDPSLLPPVTAAAGPVDPELGALRAERGISPAVPGGFWPTPGWSIVPGAVFWALAFIPLVKAVLHVLPLSLTRSRTVRFRRKIKAGQAPGQAKRKPGPQKERRLTCNDSKRSVGDAAPGTEHGLQANWLFVCSLREAPISLESPFASALLGPDLREKRLAGKLISLSH
jgi:hypothetical protein